ncbi:MAG: nucleoside deaminase [Tannerella sp.]|jgi:tRNA(adenine34) deaminase|nr:nucleoside deaminase [Tannerella sp.]
MTLFTDEYFMNQALAEARAAAAEGEVPVGAVVVCRNQIIARAHNQTERLADPTAHAEMLALTGATGVLGAKYLTDCALYVTLEPCAMCAAAAGLAQISLLTYGASDSKRGFRRYAPGVLHPKTLVRHGVREEACAALMQAFFREKRRGGWVPS